MDRIWLALGVPDIPGSEPVRLYADDQKVADWQRQSEYVKSQGGKFKANDLHAIVAELVGEWTNSRG